MRRVDDLDRVRERRADNRKIVLVKDLEDDKAYRRARKRRFILRLAGIIALVLAVLLIINGIRSVMHKHAYKSLQLVKQIELSDSSASNEYKTYGDGVIRYGRNGAEYINSGGKTVWQISYEMEKPVVETEDDYVVVADIGGTSFTICNSNGMISEGSVLKSILDADISDSGSVCLVLDDDTANYINFFDKNARQLDIEIKTILAGDGYPMDMSLSSDGQMIMISYLYMNEGIMLNKVVFYNFSELGQNYADRLVGVFNEYEEAIVPVVSMMSDSYACAFAQDRVSFFSVKNSTKPSLIKTFAYEGEIKSVFNSDKYVGVISSTDEGVAGDYLDVYTAEGKRVAHALISFEYEDVKFYKDYILLNDKSTCILYTVDGNLKFRGVVGGEIDYIDGIRGSRLISFNDTRMSELKLKY
ncbi:MAG: hypothetical protein IJM37_06485 [Lachnospiraceae bacterium]|nr:hypothetical protein [Lachnospiraceae bacterium]